MKAIATTLIIFSLLMVIVSCGDNSSDTNPVPEITSITPSSGPTGSTVTINGSGFSTTAPENSVTFNGSSAVVNSATSNQVEAVVPEQATSGVVKVTVQGLTAVGPNFTIDEQMPAITAVEPDSGVVGTQVTISGMNFSPNPSENIVIYNGGVIAEVQEASETELVTQVPEGAESGPIKIEVDNQNTVTPSFKVITKGVLEAIITTSVEGNNADSFDEDGYILTIDGTQKFYTEGFVFTDTLYVKNLTMGVHEANLSDLTPNCEVVTKNPLLFDIVAGDTTQVQFAVVCEKVERQFIYISNRAESNIFTRDVACCDPPIQLTNDLYAKSHISFSLNSNTIVYQASDGLNPPSIYIVDAEGTNPPQRVNAEGDFGEEPSISSDGTQIAYFGSLNGPVGLVIAKIDGIETSFQLLPLPHTPGNPSWSPDGTQIAYHAFVDGDLEIFVGNLSSGTLTPITDNAVVDKSPSWSPDGTQITYVSDDGVYVANADGSGTPLNLTNTTPSNIIEPEWSPDGTKIVYYDIDGSDFDIFVVNADGSGSPINVTNNSTNDLNPKWSPDGLQIIYEGIDFDGDSEIYVINADGTGLIKLTNNSIDDVRPLWGGLR